MKIVSEILNTILKGDCFSWEPKYVNTPKLSLDILVGIEITEHKHHILNEQG